MLQLGRAIVVDALRFQLSGESELHLAGALRTDAAQAELSALFQELHTHVLSKKLASFTIDVRALDFVNSSSLRVFVNWIARADAAHYKLIFMTDRLITWHRLSFSVLQSLAPSSVEIVERSPNVPVYANGRTK